MAAAAFSRRARPTAAHTLASGGPAPAHRGPFPLAQWACPGPPRPGLRARPPWPPPSSRNYSGNRNKTAVRRYLNFISEQMVASSFTEVTAINSLRPMKRCAHRGCSVRLRARLRLAEPGHGTTAVACSGQNGWMSLVLATWSKTPPLPRAT